MPPISITKVLTAKQWEIQLAAMNDPHYNSTTNNADDKYFAVEAYLRQVNANGIPLRTVEAGDIIVITYDKDYGPVDDSDSEINELQKYIDKYGKDANGNPIYAIDNSLVGPYIVTIPTYDPELNMDETSDLNVQVQKLSFPDASIISVNNKYADEKGNVNLSLANILRDDVANTTIGTDLATAICNIVPSSIIMGGHFSIYELANDTEGQKIPVPYAKLKEVTDLSAAVFERFTLTDETIVKLSGNVYTKIDNVDKKLTDNINTLSANVFNKIDTVNGELIQNIETVNDNLMNEITTLSGNVYAKIDTVNTEFANKIGNADQEAAEGNYELIINNSVLSQLRRIYGDLTTITSDITTISGKVDTLSGTVDANHNAFNTLKITLQNEAVAGLKHIETNWEHILENSSEIPTGTLEYNKVKIESVGVDHFIGGIDGIGTFNTKNLEVGQYIHTLKIPGDFQIVATYITENKEFRLVYPDVVYSQNANYISILSEDSTVPGLPWKFFITKNILIK
jgi:hypothetical protein